MSDLLKFSLLMLLVCLVTSSHKVRYDNWKACRVYPQNQAQVDHILNASSHKWISQYGRGYVDYYLSPTQFSHFQHVVQEINVDFEVTIENLQILIDQQEIRPRKSYNDFGWTEYQTIESIYEWLASLEQKYPDVVRQVVGGQTYEGREIRGIEINFDPNNPGVYIEAGIHAREWITPAASSWIVNEVLKSSSDSTWRKFNYLYFPSVNPDGYVYSYTTNRMWRKNRKPYSPCYGVDLNRNWDYHWADVGVSPDPCSEIYCGPNASSEIETQTLSEYLRQVGEKYDVFIGFHSFSQIILFPWGYTDAPAPHNDLWQRIGDLAAEDILKVHGLQFEVGPIYSTIYGTSGTSLEWYYGTFNNTLAFTFEARDKGKFGFVLPAEQIIPAAEELQAGVLRFLNEYKNLGSSK